MSSPVHPPLFRVGRLAALAAASAVCLCSLPLQAATQYFDPDNTVPTVTADNGNFDTTTTDWTSTAATPTANALFATGSIAVFAGTGATASSTVNTNAGTDGTADQYVVTLNSAVSALNVYFNNTGFDLVGNSANAAAARTLSVTNTSSGVITVASGKSADIGSSAIVAFNATSNTGQRITLGGTGSVLNILSGGTLTKNGIDSSPTTTGAQLGFTGTGTVNVAGTLSFAPATAGAYGGIVVANAGTDNVTMNVNGGAVSSNSNANGIVLVNTSGGTAVLTLNSGTVSTTSTTSGVGVSLIGSNGGTAITSTTSTSTFNLNGGTLSTLLVNQLGTGTGTFNFNGGTLTGIATNTAFMTGLSAANVLAGGANINTGAFTLTIGQALLASTTSTGGGLTINGSGTGNTGTLILTGASTYTGTTTISAGTLQLGNGTTGLDGTIASTSGVTNNGTLIYNRFAASTAGYVISGSGGVTVSGTGTQTLTATSTYTGATLINAGATLQLGNGTTGNNGTLSATTSLTDNGTLIYNRADNLNFTRVISGTGAVVKTGSSNQTFSGANTYSGGTTVNAGMLTVAMGGAIGTGNLTVSSAAQFTLATGVVLTNMTGSTVTLTDTTSLFNLNGTGVQDTVANLIVNGTMQVPGTYGAPGSGAMFTGLAEFTGTGELMVGPVPEPSTWAMLLGGVLGLALLRARGRRAA